MAPYRNSRTGARSTRTQIDHDVFEGLPVRHWRKRSFNVNAAPEKDNLDPLGTGDTGWPELPMPRDAHMYSPMSEALLRAARMGQVKKPATPLMDDDKEPGEDEDADRTFDMGFVARRWAVVPKDMEGPEPEFLAKRRKGLPSVYTGATGPLGNTTQMRKTKIRKVDTEGNSYIWEVLVPEGQAVDGEIVEEETRPTQAPAPGTVVEGLGVVNAEGVVIAGDQAMSTANRRRPPPPKRKPKGPGRGRKKKVAFMPGTEGVAAVNGVSAMLNGSSSGADDGRSPKMEHGIPDGDTEMGDETTLQEGEEGSEEGSEGEEGEDGDREEGELSPSPTPAKSSEEPPTIVVHDVKVEATEIRGDASPSQSKGPLSSPEEPMHEESSDHMLLDDDGDDPINHSISEPTMTSISQSTEFLTDLAAPVTAEASEETMPTPESILRPSEIVFEERHGKSIAEPEPEPKAATRSMTTPPPDTASKPLPEPVVQSVPAMTTKILAEQPTESVADILVRRGTEPTFNYPAERVTESVAFSTPDIVAGQTPGASADHAEAAALDTKTDDMEGSITECKPSSSMGVASEPTSSDELKSTTEATMEPSGELEIKPPFEHTTESVLESYEEPKPLEMPQPLAGRLLAEQCVSEELIAKKPMPEQPVSEQLILERPSLEQPPPEQFSSQQAMPEQQPLLEQPVPEPPVQEQPMPEQPSPKQPTPQQPSPQQPSPQQPMQEPWVRSATEPFPEAMSPERRFSLTRVTTSPHAPTPSPPTPIENSFGRKDPYLSPKAPTMSPPTPIERSMSSSPDIPLANQHFRLPPQVDAPQEADQVPAPDMPHISVADGMSVDSAPDLTDGVNAQLPIQHNILDGMSEARVVEESEGSTQHFTDGEEDLLGSLERSLGKHGGRS